MNGEIIAVVPILYQNRMYRPGEPLPANNALLRQAWLDAGSARIKGQTETERKAETGEREQEDITGEAESAPEQKIGRRGRPAGKKA